MSAVANPATGKAATLPDAGALDRALSGATPHEIVDTARRIVGRERLAVVSSFGTESAALLKIVADVDAAIPVVFLDTGWLFEETLAYRDTVVAHLGLRDVRVVKPAAEIARADPGNELWFSDPDACCHLRKVVPLERALAPFSAWMNGRKRFQGGLRATMPVVESDGARLKFNPLANISIDEIKAMFAAGGLPRHPLAASGFASVGCMPCTTRTRPGEQSRAGRWRDNGKTECGIHTMTVS